MKGRFGVAFAALLILAALALPVAAAAPTSFAQIWTQGQFVSVAVAAVFLSMFFVALGYMLGYAFRQPQIVTWAKGEFYQVIASALMVAFMLWFVTALSTFSVDLTRDIPACSGVTIPTGPGETTETGTGWTTSYHIDCAQNLLLQGEKYLIIQADQLVSVNMRIQFLAGFNKNFDISTNPPGYPTPLPDVYPAEWAIGLSFQPYAGVTMLSDAISLMMPFLFGWISSYIAQGFMLAMIRDALFPILLVLGIILRTFFFTRKIGGLLMAIALCLYTIYPMMYIVFADYVVPNPNNIWLDRYDVWTCTCDLKPYDIGAGTTWGSGAATLSIGNDNCPVTLCLIDLIPMVFLGIGPNMISMFMTNWLFVVAALIGRTMVAAMFIPLLVVIVTVSASKGLSPLFGGDVEIAGLTHLI